MTEILAGLLAAVISLSLNNVVASVKTEAAVTYFAPFIEEVAKTFGGYYLGGSIFFVHVVFGSIEAVYDFIKSRKIIGLTAAMISLISHSIFGYITITFYEISGNLFWGFFAAFLTHFLWNWVVVRFFDKKNVL